MCQLPLLLFFLVSINVSFVEKTSYPKDIIQSQNSLYTLVASYYPGLEIVLDKVSLVREGKVVWSKVCSGESHFFVGNKGNTAAMVPRGESALLIFYDEKGNRVGDAECRFAQGGTYTNDGEHFFFLSATEGLYLFDKQGRVENCYESCNKFVASFDGQVVAMVLGDKLKVYVKEKQKLHSTLPSSNIRSMRISNDGRFLALVDKHNLLVFDLVESKEIYRVMIKNPTALAISPDGRLIACTSEERNATSKVTAYLYNLNKEKVWEWSVKFTKDYETVHRIDFHENGFLNIYSSDDLFRFLIRQED